MRTAFAALTLSVVAFAISIIPALAQDESDLYGDAVYNIPTSIAFGDGIYGTTLVYGVIASIALIIVAAILTMLLMDRSPRK